MRMHISEYLNERELSQAQFGAEIGVSQSAVERYVNRKRIPDEDVMRRIYQITKGQVTANDFYDLPAPPGRNGKKRRTNGS